MKDFELLKRTFPISEFDRICDGHDYILKNSTLEERLEWGITKFQWIIRKDERYIYQVAKIGEEFKTMYLSFSNYEIIRKYIFKNDDE